MIERLRELWKSPDPWLAVAATVLALPTLSYVFGRDQAHHFYVARWWLHGYVPYRDTFHDKQPMLYLTHLLGIAIGGVGTVGIRVVDLLATLALGALVVEAIDRGGRAPARGEIGAGMLLATASYYCMLDYWDTAHAEYWQAIWLLAAWFAARRITSLPWAALVSGVLSSAAVLYKPTAAVVALGVAAVLLGRAWATPSRWKATGWAALVHGLGGLAPLLVFVAYFAWKGALRDWYECTIVFPSAYASTPTPPGAAASLLRVFLVHSASGWILWFGFAWVAAMAIAWRDRDDGRLQNGIEAAGLLVLSAATVLLQRKYFVYHWALAMPFLLQCGAFGLAAVAERRWRLATALAVVVSLSGVAQAPAWASQYYAGVAKPLTFRDYSIAWWFGGNPKPAKPFLGPYGFDHDDLQAVASFIHERARPRDRLVVRGFEPVIYTMTDLRCPTRFQSDHAFNEFTDDFALSAAWREEHDRRIARFRPRFVVTTRRLLAEDLEQLRPLGYAEAFRKGQFVVLVTEAPGRLRRRAGKQP